MLERISSILWLGFIVFMTIGAYFWFDDFARFIQTF